MRSGPALDAIATATRAVAVGGVAKVSLATLSTLQPRWTRSRFLDEVWVAERAYPGESYPIKIIFERIPPQWRLFARLFLVLAEHPLGRRKVKRRIRSAWRSRNTFFELIWLASFLEREGLGAFCEVSPETAVRALREWASTPKRASIEARGITSYVQMVATLERLYHLGPAQHALLPDGLTFDPTTLPGPAELGFNVAPSRKTPELQEVVAQRAWQAAYGWLQTVAPQLLKCIPTASDISSLPGHDTGSRSFRARRNELTADSQYAADLTSLLSSLPFDVSVLLRSRPSATTHLGGSLELAKCRSVEVVGAAWDLTIAAAYIVMAMLSGFRIGELLSISSGGLRESPTGWRVTSTIWKTASRDTGYLTERPVPGGFAEAHQVLQRLLAASGRPQDEVPIFQNARHVLPSRERMNELVNRFTSLHGIDWHFASHQFRKFFAIIYIRRFKGPIDALRWHFRHMTREMIESYIRDAVNARYLAEAKAAETEEIFASIIHGDGNYSFPPPVSRYEGILERYRALNLPLEEIEDIIHSAAAKDGARFFAMEWGYCVDPLAVTGAEVCSPDRPSPDRGLAVPGDCFCCPHFLVGRENEARIRQSLALHQDIIGHPSSAPLAKKLSRDLVERLGSALVSIGASRPLAGKGRCAPR